MAKKFHTPTTGTICRSLELRAFVCTAQKSHDSDRRDGRHNRQTYRRSRRSSATRTQELHDAHRLTKPYGFQLVRLLRLFPDDPDGLLRDASPVPMDGDFMRELLLHVVESSVRTRSSVPPYELGCASHGQQTQTYYPKTTIFVTSIVQSRGSFSFQAFRLRVDIVLDAVQIRQ